MERPLSMLTTCNCARRNKLAASEYRVVTTLKRAAEPRVARFNHLLSPCENGVYNTGPLNAINRCVRAHNRAVIGLVLAPSTSDSTLAQVSRRASANAMRDLLVRAWNVSAAPA